MRLLRLGADADTLEQIESLRQGAALQSYLSLTDPRVHRLVEFGEADGYFFLAAEYYEGCTLSELVRKGPLPVGRAAYIVAEVSDIIQGAHATKLTIGGASVTGIVHGDIKPRNIYLTYGGGHKVSIVSFDITMAISASTKSTTNNFGSPGYMPPERLQTLAVDRRTDIWALAVTLYELISGTMPYETTNEKGHDICRSPMREIPESCPGALASILRRSLAIEQSRRLQTAADFHGSLRSFLGGAADSEASSLEHDVKQMLIGPNYRSCFISYSTKDQALAERLYEDLMTAGVRCWYAPHSVRGGRKLHEQIYAAIGDHDRLLLILSGDSMNSQWVQAEILSTRAREIEEHRQILFPIRIVSFDAIRRWQCFDADSGRDAAREIREYYIPDFTEWTDRTTYQQALANLLDDLRTDEARPSPSTIQQF